MRGRLIGFTKNNFPLPELADEIEGKKGRKETEKGNPYKWFDMLVLTVVAFEANGYDECDISIRDIAKKCGYGVSTGYKTDLFQRIENSLQNLALRGSGDIVQLTGGRANIDKPAEKSRYWVEYTRIEKGARFVGIWGDEFKEIQKIGAQRGNTVESAYRVYMGIKSHMITYPEFSVGKFTKGYGAWVSHRRLSQISGVSLGTVEKYIKALVDAEMIGYRPGKGDNDSIFASAQDEDLLDAIENRMVNWNRDHHKGTKYGHFYSTCAGKAPKTFCR